MIESIEKLVGQIQASEVELKSVEKEIEKIDDKRIKNMIEIAIKGMKFEKIYEDKKTYNDNGNYYYSDEITYFKDEQGNYLKGVKICEKSLEYNTDSYGGNEKARELFLLQDGSLKVFYILKKWSNCQDGVNSYNREFSEHQDITEFDVDKIIDNIEEILTDRLEKLGERSKAQSKRLEKLQTLKIS
jgi:hypothetical protein